jgi:hypothetical protein
MTLVWCSLKQRVVLHGSSLRSTGPDSGEFLAATNTKMSTHELEAPSGFRYVFTASGRYGGAWGTSGMQLASVLASNCCRRMIYISHQRGWLYMEDNGKFWDSLVRGCMLGASLVVNQVPLVRDTMRGTHSRTWSTSIPTACRTQTEEPPGSVKWQINFIKCSPILYDVSHPKSLHDNEPSSLHFPQIYNFDGSHDHFHGIGHVRSAVFLNSMLVAPSHNWAHNIS